MQVKTKSSPKSVTSDSLDDIDPSLLTLILRNPIAIWVSFVVNHFCLQMVSVLFLLSFKQVHEGREKFFVTIRKRILNVYNANLITSHGAYIWFN